MDEISRLIHGKCGMKLSFFQSTFFIASYTVISLLTSHNSYKKCLPHTVLKHNVIPAEFQARHRDLVTVLIPNKARHLLCSLMSVTVIYANEGYSVNKNPCRTKILLWIVGLHLFPEELCDTCEQRRHSSIWFSHSFLVPVAIPRDSCLLFIL